jgi:hypothetical protein
MTKVDAGRDDIPDFFSCPLCRDKPLKLFDIEHEQGVPDVLFIFFCSKCDAEVQYSIMRDTMEEVKETLMRARMRATALDSQYKATSSVDSQA